MRTLIRLEKGNYKDQYGFEHECYLIVQKVCVEHTGETYDYAYYSETIRNPIYVSEGGGLKFKLMVPTDFGCSGSWRQVDTVVQARDIWVEDRGKDKPIFYCGKPVIEELEKHSFGKLNNFYQPL